MPTFTAYQALRDSPFTLRSGDDQTIRWNPSNDIRQDNGDNRAIICYRVDPTHGSRNMRLKIQLNGVDIGSNSKFSDSVPRTFMEIVNRPANTGNNNITFEVTSGTGSLVISDVIAWYKRFVH